APLGSPLALLASLDVLVLAGPLRALLHTTGWHLEHLLSRSPSLPTPVRAGETRPKSGRERSGELALEDLAGGVARQRVEELHLARDLVAGEVRLHVGLHLVLAQVAA